MSYLLPVNGSHLQFLVYPHIGQCPWSSSRVAWPQKHVYGRWNSDAIAYTSWHERYFLYQLRLTAAVFDFWHTQIVDSVCSCPVVLLSFDNMGIANGISLLSCIQDEVFVISYLLPGNSDRWNLVLILYTSWDDGLCASTSGEWPPYLIYHSPWRRTVCALVRLCCWTPKTWI